MDGVLEAQAAGRPRLLHARATGARADAGDGRLRSPPAQGATPKSRRAATRSWPGSQSTCRGARERNLGRAARAPRLPRTIQVRGLMRAAGARSLGVYPLTLHMSAPAARRTRSRSATAPLRGRDRGGPAQAQRGPARAGAGGNAMSAGDAQAPRSPAPARPRARAVPGRRLPLALLSARIAARGAPRGARRITRPPARARPSSSRPPSARRCVSFRRDGRAVPMPRVGRAGGEASYDAPSAHSGKVKRLGTTYACCSPRCTVRRTTAGRAASRLERGCSGRGEEPRAERALAHFAMASAGRCSSGRWTCSASTWLLGATPRGACRGVSGADADRRHG